MKLNSIFLLFALSLFASCSDDDETMAPYFSVEGNPTSLSVDNIGISTDLTKAKQYIVRSNRPWKIMPQGDDTWVRIFPMEGEADGVFRVSVEENAVFEPRVMNFSFVVDGEEQPTLFRVEQAASVPGITIAGAEKGLVLARDGGEATVAVKANVNWKYTLQQEQDWLTVKEVTEKGIVVSAGSNTIGKTLTATLTLTGTDHPEVSQSIVISQTGALLYEDFSWLNYGNEIHYETAGETAITKWTPDELSHGWTSRSGWCYARPGFIKLGKTSYGGDVISPKLSSVAGTQDVKLTFKATAYISAGGAKDETVLYIGVLGSGVVTGTTTTVNYGGTDMTCATFSISNYPNSSKVENGEEYDVWAPEIATRQLSITGVTADTQIVFLGGAYDAALGTNNKNRIFLDEIVVLEE